MIDQNLVIHRFRLDLLDNLTLDSFDKKFCSSLNIEKSFIQLGSTSWKEVQNQSRQEVDCNYSLCHSLGVSDKYSLQLLLSSFAFIHVCPTAPLPLLNNVKKRGKSCSCCCYNFSSKIDHSPYQCQWPSQEFEIAGIKINKC